MSELRAIKVSDLGERIVPRRWGTVPPDDMAPEEVAAAWRGSLADRACMEREFVTGGPCGEHETCGGGVAAHPVSTEWAVLTCLKCNLRVHYPRSAKTWLALETYFTDTLTPKVPSA